MDKKVTWPQQDYLQYYPITESEHITAHEILCIGTESCDSKICEDFPHTFNTAFKSSTALRLTEAYNWFRPYILR
jgi:hypothetical protein